LALGGAAAEGGQLCGGNFQGMMGFYRPAMRFDVSNDRRWMAAWGLLLALAAAGCDFSGQYEKRFDESLRSSGLRAVFDQQLFAAETPVTDSTQRGTGVQLRLPTLIDKDAKPLPAADARAQPPFMKLPNLSFAYERQLDDGNGQNFLPTYIYFATVPKVDDKKVALKAEDLQKSLLQQVAAAFPGAAWADATLSTPEGTMLNLKRIRVEGKMDFMNMTVAPPAVVKSDGRFDLYLIDAPEHHVLIGWRSPKAQGARYFYTASDTAMGTVKTAAPAAPPPDAGGEPKAP
jgi:hypothetical protein